jgi:hypothetical protein
MASWWKEPVAAHTMIMLSCDDDTTRLPSCEKLTAATPSLWPVSVPLSEPSADLAHAKSNPQSVFMSCVCGGVCVCHVFVLP